MEFLFSNHNPGVSDHNIKELKYYWGTWRLENIHKYKGMYAGFYKETLICVKPSFIETSNEMINLIGCKGKGRLIIHVGYEENPAIDI